MRKLLAVVGFFIFAGSSRAATDFYITQNGTGGGTSCSDPLSVSWFDSSNNWGSGSAQIGAGKTVHLCGTFTGTAGQELLTVHGSGASGSPITIKFETGAVLTAPYWSAFGAINAQGWSYITIDGGTNGVIENTANGTSPTYQYQQQSRAIYAGSCTGCVVQNITIANMYVHTSPSDTAIAQTGVNCVYGNFSNNLTISNMTCHDVGWAITGPGNNWTISGSNIYNMDHGLAFGDNTPGHSYSGVTIYANRIHDMANWDTGSADAYHHDGIHLWGENASHGCTSSDTGYSVVSNVTIYNNTFNGDPGGNLTASIFLQCYLSNVDIYNNVFSYPAGRGTSDGIVSYGNTGVAGGAKNISVLNNTIVGGDRGAADGCVSLQRNNANEKDMTLLDNVVAHCDTSLIGANGTFAAGSTNPPAGLK